MERITDSLGPRIHDAWQVTNAAVRQILTAHDPNPGEP